MSDATVWFTSLSGSYACHSVPSASKFRVTDVSAIVHTAVHVYA